MKAISKEQLSGILGYDVETIGTLCDLAKTTGEKIKFADATFWLLGESWEDYGEWYFAGSVRCFAPDGTRYIVEGTSVYR